MAEDLRQLHTDGKVAKEGFVRVHDVSGAEDGEYTKYAGFTVVPRSHKEGRMMNGKVSVPVLARMVDRDYKIVKEGMIMPFESLNQPTFPGIGEPAPPPAAERKPVTVEDIRSVLRDDDEIERGETGRGRSAQTPADPTTGQMMQMMLMMMQQQMQQNNPMRSVQAQPAPSPEPGDFDLTPPAVPRPVQHTGPRKVSFAGDFGTIRTTYDTVVVRDDCVVLGSPADVEGAYEPPVNSEKTLTLQIAGQPGTLQVVNPGLSFEYKGDTLTVLLVAKQ